MQNRVILAASAFSTLIGVAGLVGSVSILWLFLNGTIYNIPIISPLFKMFIGQTLYLGIYVVTASLAHIAVGLLLWKKSRMGGYLGFALSACEVLSYLVVLLYPNLALPMVACLGLGSILSILLVVAWDHLS
jgi:hypothetical protein